jgi:hypothetical protein
LAGKAKIGAGIALDGEKEFKQALAAINSELKVHKSELELISAQYSKNATSEEALTKKSEVLQKRIEAQRQAVEVYEQALARSAEQNGAASSKTLNWQVSLNKAKAELEKLNTELEENKTALNVAKSQTGELSNTLNAFAKTSASTTKIIDAEGKSLNSSRGEALNLNSALGALSDLTGGTLSPAITDFVSVLIGGGGFVAGIGTAVGAVKELGQYLIDLTEKTAGAADNLLTMSSITGLSTETLQELTYASEFVDVSVDTMASSLSKLTRSMAEAKDKTSEQAKAFKQLHVSVTDAHGKLRDSEDVFYATIDALGKVSNETERDALAMQIFGRSAQELNPLIEAGSSKLKELAKEAHDTGYVMSDDMVNSFGEFDDAINRMNFSIDAIHNKIAGEFIQTLEKATLVNIAFIKSFLNGESVFKGLSNVSKILKKVNTQNNSKIPAYATGTSYHPGGYALVGEQGPEIVELPKGSRVYPNGTMPTASGTTQYITVQVSSDKLQSVADVVKLFEGFTQVKNAGKVGF